ncbi:sugar transferase [Tsuneonella sp. SYSU-LHT278]|uniref:sugar transferase n=1 Tax=Tsuneonella sediminis TaxID=3416089 RepID=UPI003F7954B0
MNAPFDRRLGATGTADPLAPSLERRRVRLYMSMVLLDVAILFAGFGLMELAYLGWSREIHLFEAQLLLPLYLTLALYQRAYSIRSLQDWQYAALRTAAALGLAAGLLLFVVFYAKITANFSRVVFTGGMAITLMMLAASRRWLIWWIRRAWGVSVVNELVIEAGGPPVPLADAIRIDTIARGLLPDPSDPDALDRIGHCLLNMDRVIVSCPFAQRNQWARILRAAGVRGEIVTDRLDELAPIGLTVSSGWRALVVSTGPLGMRQRVMKRVFDVFVALGALIVTAPIFALTALAIKLEDGGPVFFVQRRLGRGNRFFSMFKFRSMRVDAGDLAGARSASRDDDRTTRVGRFIRRTSIDELPQLFNVLAGDMSVVGPRPHAIASQAGDKLFWEVDGAYWDRHSLKPGVTGLAQIRGHRGATDEEKHLTDRLRADLEYIAGWSLWGDAMIVFKTIGVIIHPRAF